MPDKKQPDPPFRLRRAPLQLAIWTALREAGEPLRLEEIAERLGPQWAYGSVKTTAWRMAQASSPYIVSLPSGFYALPEHPTGTAASPEETARGDAARPHTHRGKPRIAGNGEPRADPAAPLPPEVLARLHTVPSVRYLEGGQILHVGPAVRDRRAVPTLANGQVPPFEDAAVTSDALRSIGLLPGDRMDLQACDDFVSAGVYLVLFDGHPDLYLVARTPTGGFAFRNDYGEFQVDPGADGAWVDRASGLTARFRFFRRLLKATRTYATPAGPITRRGAHQPPGSSGGSQTALF